MTSRRKPKAEQLPLIGSRYGREPNPPLKLLVADPPWPFNDRLPGEGRGADKHYVAGQKEGLTIAELCAFELPAVADNAVLVLWRVSSMVEEAYQVVRAWGFTPKSEIVWIKMRVCGPCGGTGRRDGDSFEVCSSCGGEGEKEHFGMGRTVRAAHESAIVATRGRPEILSHSERSTLRAQMPIDPSGKLIHSAKPEAFYKKLERLFTGPRGELFARMQRPGWWCQGDEIGLLAPVADGVLAHQTRPAMYEIRVRTDILEAVREQTRPAAAELRAITSATPDEQRRISALDPVLSRGPSYDNRCVDGRHDWTPGSIVGTTICFECGVERGSS